MGTRRACSNSERRTEMASIFFNEPPKRGPEASQDSGEPSADAPRLHVAQWLYWSRQTRPGDGLDDMYGEPVWDILLDLYISHHSSTPVYVSSLCIGAKVPITTGLRYVSALEKSGWLKRTPDRADHRRVLVTLSASAIERMNSYFDRVAEMWRVSISRGDDVGQGQPASAGNDRDEILPSARTRHAVGG